MTRSTIVSAALLFGIGAFAAYDKFHYTTEASQWTCPGMAWQCIAPSICAHDNVVDMYHCCDTGAEDAVCWNNSSPCEGEEDKTPGSNQIGCSSGDNAFCCLKQREECTQRFNQINVCWETAVDPFRNVSQAKMNETFSSLSFANPSASTLAVVDIAVLTATATPSSSSSLPATSSPISPFTAYTTSISAHRSQSAPTSTQTSTSLLSDILTTASAESQSDNGVSGGTIGGAVVGAIAGIALIGGGAFFLFRRKRGPKSIPKGSELDNHSAPNPYVGNDMYQQSLPQEKYSHEVTVQTHTSYPLQELSGNNQPVEIDGTCLPPPNVPHSFT